MHDSMPRKNSAELLMFSTNSNLCLVCDWRKPAPGCVNASLTLLSYTHIHAQNAGELITFMVQKLEFNSLLRRAPALSDFEGMQLKIPEIQLLCNIRGGLQFSWHRRGVTTMQLTQEGTDYSASDIAAIIGNVFAGMDWKQMKYTVPEEDNKGVLQQSFPALESRISHLSTGTNSLCCMAGNIRRTYHINL